MLTKHWKTTGRKIQEIMSKHNTTNSNAFFHFQKINMKKKRTKQLVNSLSLSAVIKGNPQSMTSVTNLPILRHISKAPLNSENSYFDTM